MTHVEGDRGEPVGSRICPTATVYQTLPLPPPGQTSTESFAVDIAGTELLREILQNNHDSYGSEPKLFIDPAGEFWQTEADPTYGGKLFQKYDYQALGYEFGIQGHGIYYSGANFCWYNSPHIAEGVQRKLTDLHNAAQTVVRNGQPVNGGLTYTGGWKLEKDALEGKFPGSDEESEGSLDEPFGQYKWHVKLRRVEIPVPPQEEQGAQTQLIQMIAKQIGEALREIKLSVSWEELSEKQEVVVTTHVVKK